MLRLKITTENGESTLFVEDSPFSESIPISEEPDNQIVDLLDGLYVPLPYRTPVVQVEGSSQEVVMSQDAVTREVESVRTTVTGLSTELGNRVTLQDSRLTDAREWVAETVSEPIAIAGEDTRRWAWTAQRIKQLVLGWWAGTLAQTSGDSTTKVMSQNATKTYMEDNFRDIQTILDEINRGSL